MDINSVLSEARTIAFEFGLKLRIVDLTNNAINLRLYFNDDLFAQIYANQLKSKLNQSLVFKNKRLFGADAEGHKYHIHPAANPKTHIFTENKENMGSFMLKVLKILDEKDLL